jgi:hypothetical protein
MDFTPGQQRLLFVVVVIVLAGLGIYLISGAHHPATASPPSSPTAPTTGGSASSSSTYVPPATAPPASPPATTAGGANIYQWLPFSQGDLTAAAKTTLAFAADYATWSYTETKAAYAGKLAGVATPAEVTTLESGFAAVQANAGKKVFTGIGTINGISSFGAGPTSITFSVAIATQVTPANGTAATTTQYAITAISTASGWLVNDIELATAGNH